MSRLSTIKEQTDKHVDLESEYLTERQVDERSDLLNDIDELEEVDSSDSLQYSMTQQSKILNGKANSTASSDKFSISK